LIAQVNRMDCKRKVSQVVNNNPREVDLQDDQKTEEGTVGTVCKQILIDQN
jgi:hypothetical protein